PEMQAQFLQAAEATKSPIFVYVIPVMAGLTSIWLGWIIISSLLHLSFTLAGGRGTNTSALNLVAWAGLPFSRREVLRIIYVLVAQHPIASAGLSGFVASAEGSGLIFISALLSLTDIFLFWHIALLIVGAKQTETITSTKSLAVVLSIITLSLVVQAGTSFLGSQMGGMMVSRPFFF
ncbi:MAG: YIP1 family protein, partial [Reinekea sp.]|nr:YIP1 family protein [Reinekea sp.]